MLTCTRLAAVAALLFVGPVRADYNVVDLTGLYDIRPVALNDAGQFAGTRTFPGEGQRAYRFEVASGFVNLGTLGGSTSSAAGLNAPGWVAGTSRTAGGAQHAFLWRPDTGLIDIGVPSTAAGLNAGGTVVGTAGGQAFLWTQAGGLTPLGTLGGSTSSATAVSDGGFVVGFSGTGVPDQTRAFGYRDAVEGMFDLGSLFADGSSWAAGVNAGGVVVGSSWQDDPDATRAFIWTEAAGMADLGTLGGERAEARAVNAAGLVVGTAEDDGLERRAFVWDAANGMRNLSDLIAPDQLGGLNLTAAIAVTDGGLILAENTTSDGLTLVLLTPTGGDTGGGTDPVPAPAGLLLGLVAVGLLARRRRGW